MSPTVAPDLLVVKYLLSLDSTTLNGFCDVDSAAGRLIFRQGPTIKLFGSGLRAVVVTTGPGGTANIRDAAFSQSINVRVYADHTRDASGLAPIENGGDRAWAAWGALDLVMSPANPMITTPYFFQSDRQSPPMPDYDDDLEVNFLSCVYDVAMMQNAA